MIRRVLVGLGLAVVGLVAQVGFEVLMLSRREYLPEDPGYRVDARVDPSSGSPGATPVRLAVLGDSTVVGVGSPTERESLPVLIAQRVADGAGRRGSRQAEGPQPAVGLCRGAQPDPQKRASSSTAGRFSRQEMARESVVLPEQLVPVTRMRCMKRSAWPTGVACNRRPGKAQCRRYGDPKAGRDPLSDLPPLDAAGRVLYAVRLGDPVGCADPSARHGSR